jgi:signal peptidase I
MTVKSEIYDWLQCIVVALVTSILIFVFIGRVTGIIGPSMEKTLFNNDRVVISNLFYTPKQGDIIIWTKESFMNEPIVKRVIATENQTVNIDFSTGKVWVDGVLLNETYINGQMWRHYDVTFPVKVPEGCLFVMGDNRNVSIDSRASEIGMVDKRCVLGKVYFLISPFNRFGKVN